MDKKRRLLKGAAIAVGIFTAFFVALLLGVYIFAKFNINYEADERMFEASKVWEPTKFYARDLSLDTEEYVEADSVGSVQRSVYPLDAISQELRDGFIAVEDKIFYEHRGVDWKRTLKAVCNYLFGGERRFGASTITQQVIKNISGDNDPTVTRKLTEILRAMHVESLYTKDEILELYLNVIPMGESIFGVGMASRAYFGKEPSELTPAECATLIGITNAPTAYSPYRNPEACIRKRNVVLSVMLSDGVIDSAEYDTAISSELVIKDKESFAQRSNSWFTETVMRDLIRDLSREYSVSESAAEIMLSGGGYSVYTTMDTRVQSALENFFENEANLSPEISHGLEYSMVVLDSNTGELRGIIGRAGEKKGNRLLNHATSPHTPASVLKPLSIYAPLIESGDISWSTVIDDVPISFVESEGEKRPYPANSPNVYSGLVTVKDAIRLSKNTVALKLCKRLGADRAYDGLIDRFGFTTLVDREKREGKIYTDRGIAAMALGQLTYGLPLTELTSAFNVFPSYGVYNRMRTYHTVTDTYGRVILESQPESKRVFTKETAEIMNKLLEHVVDSGTARSITLGERVSTAGKTGTSSGCRDKLFVGYTPYYTAGIWCGYESADRPVAGIAPSHLEIWDTVMTEIHSHLSDTDREFSVDGLAYRPYCMDSGDIYTDACKLDVRGNRREYGYFTPYSTPRLGCTTHVTCYYDSVSKGIASHSCPTDDLVMISLLDISDRSFPVQVDIADAEYVLRNVSGYLPRPTDTSLPYFYYALDEGEYVGITGKRRQFNCACPDH